ncbi:hypothetical protein P43SY_000238 [Pythium insidiosum]|uniref:Uncharacterized protein n=1 Tax=Pythium insidiosum TaxID=114742 RepID=A0AAD5QA24_PYTIN|nr:hypothetical protein P43SY_000238 [Pythium insidiosum]
MRSAVAVVRDHDSQEIRVCAVVFAVIAFFLFIAAEVVPTEHANVLRTLVALGTLGFAWVGPLTLLAGTMRSTRFKWWQPFQGGAEFVWMQAFGWSLHTLVLTAAFVVLANDGMDKWVEGQYLLLGVAGFTAQLLLNLSIGSFNENEADHPAMYFPWNTKAVVSMLISVSAALLFVLFDLFGHRLQSTVVLVVGAIEFIVSAVVIHVLYGCVEIPGYRLWQPFEGERIFLLLQYLGWQFFAATIAGAVLLTFGADFSSPSPTSRGAPTAVGCMGLISQVVLLLSLQCFKPTPDSEDASDMSPSEQHSCGRSHSRSYRRRRPREVYVSVLLCLGAMLVACVSYAARFHAAATMSPAFRDAFMAHEKILWRIGICAMAMASPIANVGAVRMYPDYHWWQPFLGGTKFVFLQTLGWLWYSFFLAAGIVLSLNSAAFAEAVAPFALLLGCASTGAISLSISYFQGTSPVHLAAVNAQRNLTLQHGEVAIGLLMCLSSILMIGVVDYFGGMLDPPLRTAAVLLGVLLYIASCGIANMTGRWTHAEYRILQPFEGGSRFVVRQAIGWTLFAVKLLLDALVLFVPTEHVPYGILSMTGAFGIVPHLVILSSIRYFAPSRRVADSSLSVSQHRLQPTSWLVLLRRPDLRWRLAAAVVVMIGSMLLFSVAEVLRGIARFGNAHQVLFLFGFAVANGGLSFVHCSLGPRARPGYRLLQPFSGGLRFITFQGVAWTLTGVGWTVASTALHWRSVFLTIPAINLVTGMLFFAAQGILLYSISHFQISPGIDDAASAPDVVLAQLARLDAYAEEVLVGPLLGIAACVVFVLVDVALVCWGPALPVLPITICAVLALFSAIPLSYKFARSSMGRQAKAMGGSVVFIVLGTALWSFTILLGGLFCIRLGAMNSTKGLTTAGYDAVLEATSRSTSTRFMGTFTGSVGFVAELIFFQAPNMKLSVASSLATSPSKRPTAKTVSSSVSASSRAQRVKQHVASVRSWVYSTAAVATGVIFAYTTSLLPRHLPTNQLLGMVSCSVAVVCCAWWIQRQIVASTFSGLSDTSRRPHEALESAVVRLEHECFAQIAMFLTVAELVRLMSACRALRRRQTDTFWHRQFLQRFRPGVVTLPSARAPSRWRSQGFDPPAIIAPFAGSWANSVESLLLNAICRGRMTPCVATATRRMDLSACLTNRWKLLCISREHDLWCEQCRVCGRLELLSDDGRRWEQRQRCPQRCPSTWVQVCACLNPVTLGREVAHRACLERHPAALAPCSVCGEGVGSHRRLPRTLTELCYETWTDFCSGREDFGGGFFVLVPMSSSVVVFLARSFKLGSTGLYAWVWLTMALCFVANTPRVQRALEHLGDEGSPTYVAYQRLFNAFALTSLAHVLWCLSSAPLSSVVESLLHANFAVFLMLAALVLIVYWRTSYQVSTVRAPNAGAATAAPAPAPGHLDAEALSCVTCLLHVCPPH